MNSGIEDVFEYGKEGKGFAAGNHAKDVNLGIGMTVPGCVFGPLGIKHLRRGPRQSNPVQPCFLAVWP